MLKKLVYIVIFLALALTIAAQFAYKDVWIYAVSKDKLWSYAIVDSALKNTPDFLSKISWVNPSSIEEIELDESKNNKNILFKTNLSVENISSIQHALLEYNNKYSISLYLNNKLCYKANRHLISSETDLVSESKNTLKIYENWSRAKRFINAEELSPLLKEGENTIALLVENINDLKRFSPSKISVSFLEEKLLPEEENINHFRENSSSIFSSSTLPVFKINTNNKAIPDEPKIESLLNVFDNKNENKITDEPISYQIKIERRGFSSQNFAKKSYGFSVIDDGIPRATPLLGLPAAKKWVLYGPYADKSLIRNALTYSLYNDMGHYSVKTAFIELIINDNYQGVYVLTEKINIGPNHLNIPELKIETNGITSGGYLLEVDRNKWKAIFPSSNDTSHIPLSYCLELPKKKVTDSLTQELIKKQFNHFEKNLYLQTDSLFNFLDVNTFVDHFIISEFTKNIDAYRLSTYIYNPDISAKTPKFYMGPIWDYNFAYGLTNYNDGFNPESFVYNSASYVPFWWEKLMANNTFNDALKNRYFQLRKTTLSNEYIHAKIDSFYNICKTPAQNNFKKWTVLNSKDFWPNHYLGKTYEDEIDYLKSWINKRLLFLDIEILDKKNKSPLYYEIQIRNKPEWLAETMKKAKERGISLEKMITRDANYMSKK